MAARSAQKYLHPKGFSPASGRFGVIEPGRC